MEERTTLLDEKLNPVSKDNKNEFYMEQALKGKQQYTVRYSEPLKGMTPLSKEYDEYLARITATNNMVNKLTKKTNPQIDAIKDRINIRVLANHFKKIENPTPEINKKSPETLSGKFKEELFDIMGKGITKLSIGRWCGAATNVMQNIQNDDDFNFHYAIHNICRDHDLSYTKSRTVEDIRNADIQFIKEIVDNYLINNLFQTKEQMGSLMDNIYKHIFSYKTMENLFKVGTLATGVAAIGYGLVNIPHAISNLASMGKYGFVEVPKALYKVGLGNIIANNVDPYGTRSKIYGEFTRQMAELGRWKKIAEKYGTEQDFIEPLKNLYYEEKKMKYIIKDYLPLFVTSLRSVVFGIAGGVISGAFRDTLVAMLSLVGMSVKLAADMATGFFTQSDDYIYGLTETHFQQEDISDLVYEMQTIESQRLEEIGYKAIDILNPVFEPIELQPQAIPEIEEEQIEPAQDELTVEQLKQLIDIVYYNNIV